jgi:beta-glucosidase
MKKSAFCVLSLFITLAGAVWSQPGEKSIYKDPKAAVQDRVHDLLSRMTVEEKVAQLEGGWTLPSYGAFTIPSAFDKDQLNEAMARKIAGNGLGTYSFLDEFMGLSGPPNPRSGA